MKIVLVGGGSYVFAPTVLHDLIVECKAAESELVLVDLNAEAALAMQGLGQRMASEGGIDVRIQTETDVERALPGADFVIMSASVQGLTRWRMDYQVLKRHGMADQARECGGLGGLVYTLRSVALVMDICRKMEHWCPNAILLDVTNPMPRVLTAVHKHTSIRAIGFCNMAWRGATGYEWFADLVGQPAANLDIVTAGLNHFAWLVSIRDKTSGIDLYDMVTQKIRQGQGREFTAMRRWLAEYGGIIAGHVDHHAEYLPHQEDIHYHVSPPFHGNDEERQERMQELLDIGRGRRPWNDALRHPSWEHPVQVAAALYHGNESYFDVLNLPNDAYLPQLANGRIVEVPAMVQNSQVVGKQGILLPEGVAELCRTISDVHEFVAQAAVTGDVAVAQEAIVRDPAIENKDAARRALLELLKVHADVLPQFQSPAGGARTNTF